MKARSIKKEKKITDSQSLKPSPKYGQHLARLSKAKGQIEGIERMIKEDRYCLDLITQLRAAASALKSIESEIFKSHIRGCVKQAVDSKDAFASEEKIQEIIKLLY